MPLRAARRRWFSEQRHTGKQALARVHGGGCAAGAADFLIWWIGEKEEESDCSFPPHVKEVPNERHQRHRSLKPALTRAGALPLAGEERRAPGTERHRKAPPTCDSAVHRQAPTNPRPRMPRLRPLRAASPVTICGNMLFSRAVR